MAFLIRNKIPNSFLNYNNQQFPFDSLKYKDQLINNKVNKTIEINYLQLFAVKQTCALATNGRTAVDWVSESAAFRNKSDFFSCTSVAPQMWDSPVSRVLLDAWRTTKERDERLSHGRHFHDQLRLCSHNTQHTTHFSSHLCYRLGLGQITCDRLNKKKTRSKVWILSGFFKIKQKD